MSSSESAFERKRVRVFRREFGLAALEIADDGDDVGTHGIDFDAWIAENFVGMTYWKLGYFASFFRVLL